MPSTDALFYYGLNVAHDEDGDYPTKYEELEDAPDFFGWLEDQVKSYNEEYHLEFEAAFHCCNNCSGYYITLGGMYQHRAWRGEPQKIDPQLPWVGDVLRQHLIDLGLKMGMSDPVHKMGWWLASYAEM